MNNSRIDIHENLCNELHDLYVSKNEDYGDSFRKVRNKFPTAILVRLNDKLNRLESLLGKDEDERKVKDESIDDTLMDIANYALLELVERRWDDRIDEEDEEDEDEEVEEEEDDDDPTFSECIKRISRRIEDMGNRCIRFNTFNNPNYAHYEVFGSLTGLLCNGVLHITVVGFNDNGEITAFKQEYVRICLGEASVDILTNLVTDPKILSDNKNNYHIIRNAVWNMMYQHHFQWIITRNDDFTYTFRSYIFDKNNDLIKSYVNYNVVMDINRPIVILNLERMFEKEDEDAKED